MNMNTLIAKHANAPALQRGLSLIELMISITLGLIILASLSVMFVNQSKTRVELDKFNRMYDNGRYAMGLLSRDLRLAGYFGEYSPMPSSCSNAPVGIEGFNTGVSASFASSPYTEIPVSSLRKGSDILVIRRASTEQPVAAEVAVAGVEYLQVSLCQFDTLSHIVSNNPADFTLRKKNCTPGSGAPYADLRRMFEYVYFVSPDNYPGDGIPTLKRLETNLTTGVREVVPLVEGVEYMQLEYGLDNNSTFSLKASTTAGSLDLTELSADPYTEKIKPGMGVYNVDKIPAGYTVDSVIPANSPLTAYGNHLLPTPPALVTNGVISTIKAAGAGPIVAGTNVALTIPYITGTITSGVPTVTSLSADPLQTLASAGNDICASGIPAGTTIANLSSATITLSKNATQNGVVPLNIPAMTISPKIEPGDGIADFYTDAPTTSEWPNVVSVRITILARNTEATKDYTDTKTYNLGSGLTVGPFNAPPYNASPYPTTYPMLENYKRHVYTQYIRLTNQAGRREKP